MNSTKIMCLLLSLAAATVSMAGDVTQVRWATATKGGGFQLFGQNMAEVINGVQDQLHVEALATKGSRQNLELLEAGDVDVGQVEGNAARIALDGIGRAPAQLKVLSVMYPNPGMFAVRGDSDYRVIADLRGKAVAFGTRASGLRILANDVLDGIGLRPDVDFQQIILDKAADGPRLVLEGKAQALWGAGIGWPGFVAIATGAVGARFIAPSADQVEQILRRHPHLQRMTVPAGTYPGQDHAIASVGLWSLILVRPDLDSAVAYQLARAIDTGYQELVSRLPQGRYTQAANTVRYVAPERLHPGAARYFQEIGLLADHAPVGRAVADNQPLTNSRMTTRE